MDEVPNPRELTGEAAQEVTSVPATESDAPDLSALADAVMKAAPALLSGLGSGDLSGLLGNLLGSSTETNAPAASTPPSVPAFASAAGKAGNSKTQLLKALKPYLRPERADKIDRAISMLETAYAAKTALSLFSAVSGRES